MLATPMIEPFSAIVVGTGAGDPSTKDMKGDSARRTTFETGTDCAGEPFTITCPSRTSRSSAFASIIVAATSSRRLRATPAAARTAVPDE